MKIQTVAANSKTKVKGATWLQGIGHVMGKPAGELVKDDVIVYNQGHTAIVVEVTNQTAKTITVELTYQWMGQTKKAEQKFSKTRIVAMGIR